MVWLVDIRMAKDVSSSDKELDEETTNYKLPKGKLFRNVTRCELACRYRYASWSLV